MASICGGQGPDSYPVAINESGGKVLLMRVGCHGKGQRKNSD